MFNFLIKLFSVSLFFSEPLADGSSREWVSLDSVVKNTTYMTDRGEENPSIWVVFSKRMGEEDFMVRFPENPTYTYLNPDAFRAFSRSGDSEYSLLAQKTGGVQEVEELVKQKMLDSEFGSFESVKIAENMWDLKYRKDGKWIGIRYFLSAHHLFILQSENSISHWENHQKFVDSLDVIFH